MATGLVSFSSLALRCRFLLQGRPAGDVRAATFLAAKGRFGRCEVSGGIRFVLSGRGQESVYQDLPGCGYSASVPIHGTCDRRGRATIGTRPGAGGIRGMPAAAALRSWNIKNAQLREDRDRRKQRSEQLEQQLDAARPGGLPTSRLLRQDAPAVLQSPRPDAGRIADKQLLRQDPTARTRRATRTQGGRGLRPAGMPGRACAPDWTFRS